MYNRYNNAYYSCIIIYLIESKWAGFRVNLINNLNKYMIWGMQNNKENMDSMWRVQYYLY